MFRTLLAAAGLAATALVSSPAFAQDQAPEAGVAPQAEAPEAVDEVVVRGRRMSEVEFDALRIVVRDFIGEVAAPAPGRGYARWHRRVCVGVHNLAEDAAQYVVDRISALALEVGLEPGEPGCQPDVIIIFATDAKATASYMVEEHRLMFRPQGGEGGVQLGIAALKDFSECAKPVCWWHVSLPVEARSGAPAIHVRELDTAPTVTVDGPSRVHSGVRDDLQRAIVVVDATKLTGTTWQELGDYLAVVSLAQIDPKTNPTAFDSILNLFSNPAAYSGLTDWDRSYMQALYTFDQERMPRYQSQGLVTRMATRERDGE